MFLGAAAALGTWGLLRGPWYREITLSGMSLEALQRAPGDVMSDPARLYHIGRRLNDQERFGAADPLLRQAVGLDPDSARLRDEWARALLGSGLTTAAFGQLRQFAGTHPKSADAHFILARFYFTQQSMERAREELELTVGLSPRRAEAWAYLSASRDALRDLDGALRAAKKAVALRPKDADYRVMLADLLSRSNRRAEAGREYRRSTELAPHKEVPHRAYAQWLLHTAADADLAEAEAVRAVEINPESAQAHLVLGRARVQMGRPEAALVHLQKAAALDKHDPSAPLALKQVFHLLGRPRDAEKWGRTYLARAQIAEQLRVLNQAINARPKDAGLHRRMARLLGRRGDVAGCVRHQASALKSALDAPPTLIAAANALTDGGHAAEALPLARRAVSVADANPAAHEALGNAFLGVGQFHLAGRHYNKAAGWLPERSPILRERLRRFLAHRAANPPPAERAFRQAFRLEQRMVGPKRVTPEGEALARHAVELEPTNPVYLNYLLKLQMAQRKNGEALATVDRLLELVPTDARGRALRAVLLLEKPDGEQDLQTVEADLAAAAADPSVAATRHYALGLLALQRREGPRAVRELRRAAALDPSTDVTHYKLFLAERMAGNDQAARRAMIEFEERQERKRDQAAALGDIAQHPDRPELYRRATALLERQGLSAQAEAIRAEARRRFGRPEARRQTQPGRTRGSSARAGSAAGV